MQRLTWVGSMMAVACVFQFSGCGSVLMGSSALKEVFFQGENVEGCRLVGDLLGGANHPLASGSAKFESRDDRLRLSVEIEDVDDSFIGTDAQVLVNGVDVGTIQIVCINPLDSPACTLGGFDLNLDDRDGDTIPDIVGALVCTQISVEVIVTEVGGGVIVSGTMIQKFHDGADDDPGDADANDDRCRLRGRLDASDTHSLASGKAKFEKRNDRLRISVETEDVDASFIGTMATITVAGEDIGTEEILCINQPSCTFGGFDLNLDSRDGDMVTDLIGMNDCSQVSVEVTVTDADGNVIVSGTMIVK